VRFQRFTAGKRVANPTKEAFMSILWIILIVILVLALLGFFSRGRW
jgi:flagellar basal body-associated protein FliL